MTQQELLTWTLVLMGTGLLCNSVFYGFLAAALFAVTGVAAVSALLVGCLLFYSRTQWVRMGVKTAALAIIYTVWVGVVSVECPPSGNCHPAAKLGLATSVLAMFVQAWQLRPLCKGMAAMVTDGRIDARAYG